MVNYFVVIVLNQGMMPLRGDDFGFEDFEGFLDEGVVFEFVHRVALGGLGLGGDGGGDDAGAGFKGEREALAGDAAEDFRKEGGVVLGEAVFGEDLLVGEGEDGGGAGDFHERSTFQPRRDECAVAADGGDELRPERGGVEHGCGLGGGWCGRRLGDFCGGLGLGRGRIDLRGGLGCCDGGRFDFGDGCGFRDGRWSGGHTANGGEAECFEGG